MTFYGRSHFIGPSRTEVLKLGPVNLRGIINLLQIYKHPENVMFMYIYFSEAKPITFIRFPKGFVLRN